MDCDLMALHCICWGASRTFPILICSWTLAERVCLPCAVGLVAAVLSPSPQHHLCFLNFYWLRQVGLAGCASVTRGKWCGDAYLEQLLGGCWSLSCCQDHGCSLALCWWGAWGGPATRLGEFSAEGPMHCCFIFKGTTGKHHDNYSMDRAFGCC